MKRKLLLMIICFILALSFVTGAYADSNKKNNEYSISLMTGCIYKENIDLNSSMETSATITNIDLKIGDNFYLSGNLEYNDEIYPISLEGNIYPFDGGIHESNLVLGDLNSDNERFKVINFKVFGSTRDKYLLKKNKELANKATISLVIEDLESGNIIFLQSQLNKSIFNKLLSSSRTYLKGLDIDEKSKVNKLLSLYKYNKNKSKTKTVNVDGGIHRESSEPVIQPMGAPSISYSTLKSFMDDLNSSGSVTLSNYSTSSTFFTDTGWDHFNSTSSTPRFCYSNYSKENGTGEYLSQFSLIDIVANNISAGTNIREATLQLGVYDGLIVEYSTYTDTVDVLYYGWGIEISDVELAISKLRGNLDNIFIERDVNGSMINANASYVRALIGLVPYTEYLTTIWDFASLEIQTNAIYGNEIGFDDTVADQRARYNDDVIRAVYADSGSAYMYSSSHYFKLDGKFKYQSTWSYDWSYTYDVSHNL